MPTQNLIMFSILTNLARLAALKPKPCNPAKNGLGSNDIVFLRPRLVVPGTFGPTIDDVYFIISVSGGKRTPRREDGSLQKINIY